MNSIINEGWPDKMPDYTTRTKQGQPTYVAFLARKSTRLIASLLCDYTNTMCVSMAHFSCDDKAVCYCDFTIGRTECLKQGCAGEKKMLDNLSNLGSLMTWTISDDNKTA